ncbi:MAG: DUF1570 domain-containing protein, partial [Planctomycetota bacterium]
MRLLAVVPFLLTATLLAQGDIRPGLWQTAGKVPAGWVVHNTKNYQVQSHCGEDKARRLGAHMETMLATYRKMFKPDKAGSKQQPIKLFASEAAYHAYGGRQGTAAYYHPIKHEMVCYDSGKWSDEEKPAGPTTGPETAVDRIKRRLSSFEDMMTMDLLGTAAHEGWHQYYHWLVVSQVPLPSWINEGMGDYFYTAAPNRQKKRAVAQLGGINSGRLWVLQAAKRQNRMEPLPKFLTMLQQDYYANPSICYAQGWALCQFLLHGANGKYAKVIPTYINLVKNDGNWRTVQEKAFKGIDLAVMETEFKAFIDTMKPDVADPFDPETMEEEGDDQGNPGPPVPGAGQEPATPPTGENPPAPAPAPNPEPPA